MPSDAGGSAGGVADLWAMAADLERQFAGYKQRLAERNGGVRGGSDDDDDAASPPPPPPAAYDDTGGGCKEEEPPEAAEAGVGVGVRDARGRMYEAYVRRRDERLRDGWHARMERKEAEVKALWARLELGGRAERARPATAYAGMARGDERKFERNDDDKRRSSDAALAPRRITGKKHARTRSFSSSMTASSSNNHTDVGRRRALSQEPPPSETHASGAASKDARVRPAGGAAATAKATARPKTSSFLRRKNSGKGHGSAKPAGPKLPRSLPRQASSGGLEEFGREAAAAAAPVQCRSSGEHALHGEAPKDSPLGSFVLTDDGCGGTGAADARVASPGSDCTCDELVEAAADGEPEAKNADVEERGDEKADACPSKLGSEELITSDSDTEPRCVYINKDAVEEHAMSHLPEPPVASDAEPESRVATNEEVNAEEGPPPAAAQFDARAAEIATTNADEAPARESSDEASFSGRSRGSPPNSAPSSCERTSRDQSIERLLETDAAVLRRKREERAEKPSAVKTPGSAGSRAYGAARSPREAVRGFKRFLSFGKRNKGREVTVIECTSPSVPSLADDDSASGGWQSAGSIKPRMGSSDAASDDTEHGSQVSPQAACSLQSLVAASPAKSELAEMVPQERSPKAHRSFFSFRSLNCGRRG